MHRVLVVANQTLVGAHITNFIYELRQSHDELEVFVLVPATPRQPDPSAPHDAPIKDASGTKRAHEQLRTALTALSKVGVTAKGEIGVSDPLQAVTKVMEDQTFDQILVSTLPLGTSRWIKMDIPHRIERRFGIPVLHLVGSSIENWDTRQTSKRGTTRILLIEDNHDDVDLVKTVLSNSDLQTDLRVTTHGRRALDYLRDLGQEHVDLILLDLKMPLVDGHEFLETLTKEFNIDDMNIVVVTTSDLKKDRERAYALGASAYVLKDPDFEVFSESLLSIVDEFAGSHS